MQKILLPKVIGHRGACGLAPENTIASVIKANFLRLSFIEIDVKISKDKIPILLHDETLDRTTNGSGLCCNYNYDELLELDAGKWFNSKFKNEKILSLEKCLDYIYLNKMSVNIELKPNKNKEKENIIQINNLFKKKKYNINCYMSSFDIVSLKLVSEKLPLIPRGYLFGKYNYNSIKDILDICNKYNCFSIGLELSIINQEIINYLKKNKLIITVFTVNEIKSVKEIFNMGVDSIFTDRPDIIKY